MCKKCNSSKCKCETILCTNPLVYLVKSILPIVENYIPEIKDFVNNNPQVGIAANLYISEPVQEMLNLSMTNSGNLCCPDCKTGVYYLGNSNFFEQILKLGENFCCVEYIGLDLNYNLKCCNTDFLNAIQNWIKQLAAYDLANSSFSLNDISSIVESSSFNGYSGLGIVLEFLQLNYPDLDPIIYVLITGIILIYGIVIKCDGCKIAFYTAQGYIDSLNNALAEV